MAERTQGANEYTRGRLFPIYHNHHHYPPLHVITRQYAKHEYTR